MIKINLAAVLSSTVVAFVVGGLWYSPLLFGKTYMVLRGVDPNAVTEAAMPVGEIVGEFVRWLIVTCVLAHFMALLHISDLSGAIAFGGFMWLAIYAALAGSVIHEGYSLRLYAPHAGDGLVKVLLITAILGIWRVR